MRARPPAWVREGLVAGAVAALTSGVPSTAASAVRRGDVLGSTRAAGSVLASGGVGSTTLLGTGALVHTTLSLGWAMILSRLLPRRHTAVWGAAAGLAIAALDLGLVGRRIEAIDRLDMRAQLADHVAFGASVGAALSRFRVPAA